MNQQSLQYFKQRLLQEKRELETVVEHMEATLEESQADSISELSTYDNHPADIGDELFERSKDIALREQGRNRLDKIGDALKKIDQGNYGVCESCGKEISRERLEAMPSATYCKECQENDEELPDRHIRPIEEDVIAPPYAMKTHDDSELELGDAEDNNFFDGEDAWQQVARWGTSETPQDISVHGITDFDHMYVDADENLGTTQDVESIPYEKDKDGMFYQDFNGQDDELFGDDNVSLYESEVDTED